MRGRGPVWLASGICGIPLVMAGLTWLLHTRNAAVPLPPGDEPVAASPWFDAGVLLVFSVPAALIVSRQPRSPIGWLLAAIGFGVGIGDLAGAYGYYAVVTAPGALPGAIVVLWLADLLPVWLTFAPVPLLLLLFPDGRLPSRRWRPLAWAALSALTVSLASSALYPGNLHGDPRLPENPTGFHRWVNPIDNLTVLSALLFLVLLLACLAAVVVRFRRARGVERQQLKWFAYGAAALVLTFAAFVPLTWAGLFGVILVGFGLFTACVAVAGSTLVVAALFQPARRRIQAAVDRRFNRRHYDAARIVERFSARLRDQVDLDALHGELLAVVDQTMQPTRVWLWLRSTSPR